MDPFDKTPPKITVDPGRYTRQVGTVIMKSDEPAEIYYTLDGTSPTLDSPHEPEEVVLTGVPDDAQLRYFGIDLAGNQSPEELRVWIIDRQGPAAPNDFSLTFSNPTRTVGWTAPPDPRPGGVIVARVEGQLGSSPIPGKTYAIGDTLGPGVTVVASAGPEVITATTFTESIPAQPGIVRYAAWAFDDLHNYGPPAGDYALVPIPQQTATVTIDPGAGTASIGVQPSYITLGGTITQVGTTVTLDLTMRNDTTRVLYAPKMLLTNTLTGGVTFGNQTGLVGTTPYRAYGGAILPGTTASALWTFTNVTTTAPFDLSLDIHNGYVLIANTWDRDTAGQIVDLETGGGVLPLQAGPTGQGGDAMTQDGGITPDGRYLVGARTVGAVSSFDLQTGNRLMTVELRKPKSQVPRVIIDKSGSTAYALVADGHPYNVNNNGGGGSESELVRLDAGTLTETGRLSIGVSRNHSMELSPDGKTLLIATGLVLQGVIVVDLPSFTIKTRILPDFRPQIALFAPSIEASSIVVVGEQVQVFGIDGTPSVNYPSPGTNGKVVRAAFGPNNLLWVGRRNELGYIDLTTGISTVIAGQSGIMVEVFDGKIYAARYNSMTRLDGTGVVETTLPGFSNMDGHGLHRSPF